MTVWMHKGGYILLREFKFNEEYWAVLSDDDFLVLMSDSFFRLHCVYIGRF